MPPRAAPPARPFQRDAMTGPGDQGSACPACLAVLACDPASCSVTPRARAKLCDARREHPAQTDAPVPMCSSRICSSTALPAQANPHTLHPSSAAVGVTDYSQVVMLVVRYKPVNVSERQSPVSQIRVTTSDCDRASHQPCAAKHFARPGPPEAGQGCDALCVTGKTSTILALAKDLYGPEVWLFLTRVERERISRTYDFGP